MINMNCVSVNELFRLHFLIHIPANQDFSIGSDVVFRNGKTGFFANYFSSSPVHLYVHWTKFYIYIFSCLKRSAIFSAFKETADKSFLKNADKNVKEITGNINEFLYPYIQSI